MRYINNDKIIRKDGGYFGTAKSEIVEEEDIVSVIRCNDCRWYIESEVFKSKDCTHFSGLTSPNPDDYCSYGERKEE